MIAYLLTNRISGKQYVGISKDDTPDRRWLLHLRQARGASNIGWLQLAIIKYGADSFTIEHIASARNWADLQATEIALIAQYGTYGMGFGYNMTRGGDGTTGNIRTAESRARISILQTGRRHSQERIEKIRQKAKGRKATEASRAANAAGQRGRVMRPDEIAKTANALRGRKRSPKTIAKISAALTGKKQTVEHRAKVSAALLGVPLTPEHRAAISKGITGRVLSPESREKISASLLAKHEALSVAKKAWWAAKKAVGPSEPS